MPTKATDSPYGAPMDPLVPRMRPHRTSVFGAMSRRAAELGAVNLGQGFPDIDGPVSVRDAAIAAIQEGRGNQYPPVHGVPELRQAIALHQKHFYALDVDPLDGVVVGTGASETLVAAILALVDEGDEVIVVEPYFDLYAAAIDLARGVRVAVPMIMTGGRASVDIDMLATRVTSRTRLVIINSPHNPSGSMLTDEELVGIAAIARDRDLLVLADEAYEHLVFDGVRHRPIATLAGMWERTITVGSAGKSFSFTGWKVGWATGPAQLIAAVRTVRQHMSYVSSGPFQYAIAEALALPDAYFTEAALDLQRRRDLLASGLRQCGLVAGETHGSYFVMTDVRPLGFATGAAFCEDALTRAGVAAIPVQAFCDTNVGDPYVRWTFCKRDEVLHEAIARLHKGYGSRG